MYGYYAYIIYCFCKVGQKMLLELQHGASLNYRDFVREAGAIVMPISKDQKPTSAAAAQVTAPRVPSRPDLQSEAEFEPWAHAFMAQARQDILKEAGKRPSAALGIS